MKNKNVFLDEREGTGGFLIILTGFILSMTIIIGTMTMQASTARSVAESVEHTIALQCLASCYTHPADYGEHNVWRYNRTFDPIYGGSPINPQKQFNETMIKYHLMKTNERKGVTPPKQTVLLVYDKNTNAKGALKGHPTFTIQIGNWGCFNSFWDSFIRITPDPVTVTIEDGYGAWQ